MLCCSSDVLEAFPAPALISSTITPGVQESICVCRCIIWERTTEASAGHLRCEGADDSEVEAPAAAPRSHPQHAPLLLCNPVPSSVSDGIRLVGARKRAASTVGVGSPLKAARESNGKGGNTMVSDIHNLLYGQVQTVQFAVPLN